MLKGLLNRLILSGFLCVHVLQTARAEEYRLPDSFEIATFSAETQQFYGAGIAALDRTDYNNAYNLLAKAAQLQPDAVRLNRIVAALALKRGRDRVMSADEAKDYYETAVVSLNNILRIPSSDEEFRRDVTNLLKITINEQANLAQRDVIREAKGTVFIQKLNQDLSRNSRAAAAAKKAGSVAPPAVPAVGGNVLSSGAASYPTLQGTPAGPIVPGSGTPAPPPNLPMPDYPGGLPPAPGSPPGLPPLPGAAPAPGAAPGENPIQI